MASSIVFHIFVQVLMVLLMVTHWYPVGTTAILNGGSIFGGAGSSDDRMGGDMANMAMIQNGGGAGSVGGIITTSPRFLSRGNTFRVVNGDSVVLPCEVQNLGSFVIVWRKGAALLSAGQQMISRDSRLSLSGYNLQVRDIQTADQGDYTCQIGDGSPGDLIHTVEILMAPTIQMVPSTGQTTTRMGGPVTFECRTTGNPAPAVQWSKKDGLLPSGMQVQSGYLLTLTDVKRQDGGVYQCTASNGIGQPVTAEIQLHILYAPEISVLRTWVNSGEGLEAKLDCVVNADPPGEVVWFQNSFPLQPTDRRAMSHQGLTHSLVIRNIRLSDFGNYSCSVSNSIGKDKRFIELSGKPGPPIVTSPQYSNPQEYALTWTVQSVFPVLEVRILYRMIQINSTYHHPGQWHDLLVRPHQSYNEATGERSQTYRLLNLQPDSVYECLVQTKNQHGFGELSDLHQWFTSPKGRPYVTTTNSGSSPSNSTFYSSSSITALFLLVQLVRLLVSPSVGKISK